MQTLVLEFRQGQNRVGRSLAVFTSGGRDLRAFILILVELVAQRADGDPEDIGRMSPVTKTMLQRVDNHVSFNIGNRASDQNLDIRRVLNGGSRFSAASRFRRARGEL